MNMWTSGLSMLYNAPYLLLLPLYIVLSPLCIISSSLFESVLYISFDVDEQTTLLIITLISIIVMSGFSVVRLITNRTYKSIFFYSFVFYLSCFNFILIGITYSLLRRYNLVEEVLAKIFSTLLLIYFAQKWKIKTEGDTHCRICFEETCHNDCLILRCKHTFHESCLWDWLCMKQTCPHCSKPVSE